MDSAREKIESADLKIIVSGNPVDGFTYHGPFEDQEELNAYASEILDKDEWWSAPLLNISDSDFDDRPSPDESTKKKVVWVRTEVDA